MARPTYRPPDARVGIRAARKAREELGLDLVEPLEDILRSAEEIGPPVAVVDLHDDIAGAYLLRPGGRLIFVNRVHAIHRQRFTLGHELAHHRLDHPAEVDRPQDLADFSHDPKEVQANWFASEFLLPLEGARRWFDANVTRPLTLEDVVRFGCDYGVSAKAACIRLHTAGCIPDEKLLKRLHEEIDNCDHYGMAEDLGLEFVEDELARIKEEGPREPFG